MPLKGSIPNRISEFHSGPTYAKTAAKFGAKRAQAQAVAVAFSSKRKDPPMKKAHEDGMAGEKGMSPRKAMASGAIKGGSFGAEPFHEMNGGSGMNPDHAAHTGMKGAMEDHERGTPPAVHHTKKHLPAQAAPRHGSSMDEWNREGKV
jgi:hypothetical protein